MHSSVTVSLNMPDQCYMLLNKSFLLSAKVKHLTPPPNESNSPLCLGPQNDLMM